MTRQNSVSITPYYVLRSRWIPLPVLIVCVASGTHFNQSTTTLTFNPATSAMPITLWVFNETNVWSLTLIMPSWFAGAEDEILTVTVTTGTDWIADTISIKMLPYPLDE